MMSSFRSKIGALLVKPALKKTLKEFDASEYGGAPLLGLKRFSSEDPWKCNGEGSVEFDSSMHYI